MSNNNNLRSRIINNVIEAYDCSNKKLNPNITYYDGHLYLNDVEFNCDYSIKYKCINCSNKSIISGRVFLVKIRELIKNCSNCNTTLLPQ